MKACHPASTATADDPPRQRDRCSGLTCTAVELERQFGRSNEVQESCGRLEFLDWSGVLTPASVFFFPDEAGSYLSSIQIELLYLSRLDLGRVMVGKFL
ncbi:hypothetical protein HAX54_020272 [Datura stramonium]|uniref:Uncharacterized protein n=1 Tax=Datura stramonium TaxID=4076 RepID=A0ABS8UTP1_DATST|nr:hypothetical protein [Datura stramonium]